MLAPGATLSEDESIGRGKEPMDGYKTPAWRNSLDALPTHATGTILWRGLQDAGTADALAPVTEARPAACWRLGGQGGGSSGPPWAEDRMRRKCFGDATAHQAPDKDMRRRSGRETRRERLCWTGGGFSAAHGHLQTVPQEPYASPALGVARRRSPWADSSPGRSRSAHERVASGPTGAGGALPGAFTCSYPSCVRRSWSRRPPRPTSCRPSTEASTSTRPLCGSWESWPSQAICALSALQAVSIAERYGSA